MTSRSMSVVRVGAAWGLVGILVCVFGAAHTGRAAAAPSGSARRAGRPAARHAVPVVAAPAQPDADSSEASEARETFQSLFGRDVARARGTAASSDDLVVAKRLLEVGRDATASPAFLALLCDEAYALAAPHAAGEATAAGAMELLAEHVPDRAEEAKARLASLRGEPAEPSPDEATPPAKPGAPAEPQQSAEPAATRKAELDALLATIEKKKEAGALVEAAGLCREAQALARRIQDARLGAIESAAEALARRIGLERRARDVRAMLERQPENVAVREGLVRLYLVNLNDPKRAAEVLEGVEDSGLRKYVPAAAKPLDEAPALACLELGEWYAGLAKRAPECAKADMYARAKAYLGRFVSLHKTKDMSHVRAKVAMEKVEEALAARVPAAGDASRTKASATSTSGIEDGVIKPGRWVNLLPLVDPEKDAVSGTWKRRGNTLLLTDQVKTGRIVVPVVPDGDYHLQGKFMRTSGSFDVYWHLPVRGWVVGFFLSVRSGEYGGLKEVNGMNLKDTLPGASHVVSPSRLENGRVYTVDITVRGEDETVTIAVHLDGKPYVRWSGEPEDLSLWSGWALPQRGAFGVGAWESQVTFRHLRLKMLTGEARLLRPEDADAGAADADGARPSGAVAPAP